MPLAITRSDRVTAADPGLAAYWQHWRALPFWPSGQPWFLWVVLIFDPVAAGLFQFGRISADLLGRTIGRLGIHPRAFVVTLLSASTLAYVPLELGVQPVGLSSHRAVLSFQYCRPLHYLVYFLAGAWGVGAYGIDRGLLAPVGWLVKRWALAGSAALVAYVLWLGMVGLAMAGDGPSQCKSARRPELRSLLRRRCPVHAGRVPAFCASAHPDARAARAAGRQDLWYLPDPLYFSIWHPL